MSLHGELPELHFERWKSIMKPPIIDLSMKIDESHSGRLESWKVIPKLLRWNSKLSNEATLGLTSREEDEL